MKCPNCGMENPENSGFCLTCGTDFSASEPQPQSQAETSSGGLSGVKCPNCGATNDQQAVFCTLCGENFTPAAPAPDIPPVQEAPTKKHAGLDAPVQGTLDAMTTSERFSDGVHRDLVRGEASVPELLRLARDELAKERREPAAQLFCRICELEPQNIDYREEYISNFTGRELNSWGLQRPAIKIWNDIANILIYPFQNNEWLTMLVSSIAFFIAFLIVAFIPLFAFPLILCFYAWVCTLVAKHIKWAALGRFGHPPAFDIEGWNLWYAIASGLAVSLPVFAFGLIIALLPSSVQFLMLPIFLIGMMLLQFAGPMAFLVAMLHNSGWKAFDYPMVFRSIWTCLGEYIFMQVFLFILVIWVSIISIFLSAIFIFAGFIFLFVMLYMAIVSAQLLGRLYYNNRDRLAWF